MAARDAPDPPTAERVIREADARHDRALELLEAAPALRSDPWVALTLGDASGVRDARRPGGPLGQPPLFYVARSRIAADTVTPARELLERGADPNGPAGEEWTNLSIACSRGDAALVKLLLEHGAEPNDNDSLYHSVETRDGACTRLLLEHGATVVGTNALWHALDYDRIEPVRLLLEHGGDPNEASHWPALHHAVDPQAFAGVPPAARRARCRPDGARPQGPHGLPARVSAREDGRSPRRCSSSALRTTSPLPTGHSTRSRAVRRPPSSTSMTMRGDVLIELAMRDIDGLRRVVEAVGPDFSASWGGGPRGSLLHQASWFGRRGLRGASARRGSVAGRPGRDRVRDTARLGRGRLALQPVPPRRQLLGNDGDWVASQSCSSRPGRASSRCSWRWPRPALGLARGPLALRRPSTPEVSGLGLIRGQQRLADDDCLGDGDGP